MSVASQSEQKIFPIELVLDSMKDNGYKDAAHAIAELIDNSIQAGTETDWETEVELLCYEEDSFISNRSSTRIEKIAVYDNSCGMDVDTLRSSLAFGQGTRRKAKKGIGKFGMGLPNASISQCNRVDVYSWQDKKVFHTYLDIHEIVKNGYDIVPEPKPSELPKEWKSAIKGEIKSSGTLVVWSDLDRLKWRRHKAFFSNVDFMVGRMYRYFIDNGCQIRMAAYNSECLESPDATLPFDDNVKPNDPLYLMANTNTPAPFDEEGGFIPFAEDTVKVSHNGKAYDIRIKFSIADHKFRKNFASYYPERKYSKPGDTPFGKHCARNLGISIVRAGRELELNNSFTVAYDPTERWWGAEIAFEPELDEVFGVTNNKQAATALRQLSIEELAQEEGFESKTDARKYLADQQDVRLPVVQISEAVSSKLSAIRAELKKQREGSSKAKDYTHQDKDSAADAASRYDPAR
jgi:Histidine kinase-, DNA gyrase B-, and HSP90-like ATPase